MERKVKYNYDFKLRCVEEVLNKGRSSESVATEFGGNESNIRKWVLFYKEYGASGLIPKNNRNYDPNFKLEVLKAIERKSLTLMQACLKYSISDKSVIQSWQRKFDKEGAAGLVCKPKGRPKSMQFKRKKRISSKPLTREEELLLENESLRAENALLKKLQALIQAEESKKRKP
jgi:transposase